MFQQRLFDNSEGSESQMLTSCDQSDKKTVQSQSPKYNSAILQNQVSLFKIQ
jgi:hypothetical protein